MGKTLDDSQNEPAPRSFAVMLSNLADGVAVSEMDREFWGLTKAILQDARTRGDSGESKGKIQITISVEGNAKGEADIGWDIKVTPPKKQRLKANAWLLKSGNVTFEVPRQLDLGLRAVDAPAQNLPADSEGRSLPAT